MRNLHQTLSRSWSLAAAMLPLVMAACASPVTNPPGTTSSTDTLLQTPTRTLAAILSTTPVLPSSTPTTFPFLATLPPNQYVIYYDSSENDLYAISTDGSVQAKYSDVVGIAMSPDGKLVRVGNIVYDTTSGTAEDFAFLGNMGCYLPEAESPDGQYSVVNCNDGEYYAISNQDHSRVLLSHRSHTDDNLFGAEWSPDGKWISYILTTHPSGGSDPLGQKLLFLVDTACLQGTSPCPDLSTGPINGDFFMGNEYYYDWSPDSRFVAIPSMHGGRGIQIYDTHLGQLHSLATGQWDADSLAWTRDGKWIAFTALNGNSNQDVFLVSPFGGQPTQLTDGPGNEVVLFAIGIP